MAIQQPYGADTKSIRVVTFFLLNTSESVSMLNECWAMLISIGSLDCRIPKFPWWEPVHPYRMPSWFHIKWFMIYIIYIYIAYETALQAPAQKRWACFNLYWQLPHDQKSYFTSSVISRTRFHKFIIISWVAYCKPKILTENCNATNIIQLGYCYHCSQPCHIVAKGLAHRQKVVCSNLGVDSPNHWSWSTRVPLSGNAREVFRINLCRHRNVPFSPLGPTKRCLSLETLWLECNDVFCGEGADKFDYLYHLYKFSIHYALTHNNFVIMHVETNGW